MAHRGASDLAPENTLAGFELAVEHGADLLETDVWCTTDGELVCHHDATLERMTGDPRRVDAVSTADLRSLRVRGARPYGGEGIPTLRELVARTPPDIAIVVELKDHTLQRTERLRTLLEVLGDRVPRRRAGVIAESLPLLRAVQQNAPSLVTGHIAISRPWGNRTTDLLGPWWPWLVLNPGYVRRAHRRGQRVCPLDPGLHRRLHRYLNMDVDAVLTNDPRSTRSLIDDLRRRP